MLTHDLRDAARNLRRNRGFAASAIAILAIGIAASTGLFAVLDAVVLHPLPYAGADRLARVQLLPPSGPVRAALVTATSSVSGPPTACERSAFILLPSEMPGAWICPPAHAG